MENAFPLDEEGRCALCRRGLRGLDVAYCYGAYEGLLREWVHLYKYGRVKTMTGPVVELLAAALPRQERSDGVVLVPLRRWERGFNPAELLARGIARKWDIRVIPAPRRVRHTPTQTSVSNAARRKNVSAPFACRRSPFGRRVRLVEDVLTTGATAAVCTAALRPLSVPITPLLHSEEIPNHGQ